MNELPNPPRAKDEVTRRRFLKETGVACGVALVGSRTARAREKDDAKEGEEEKLGPIPMAELGRTGEKVTILGLGTALMGHRNDNRPEIGPLIETFGEAIDLGVRYVDTARIYGRAEEALGEVLKTRRDEVFLATKVWAETAEDAEKSFDESLRLLGVEHVDVLHLHDTGGKDIDKVLGPGGSWEHIQKMKKQGKARFIGITGHSRPARFVRMLETDTVDVLMVAMNPVDRHIYGFEEKVLPTARKHRTGILAMKVYGGVKGGFRNYQRRNPYPSQMESDLHVASIRYLKSIEGITGMVIGVHDRDQLRQNIRRVLEAKPFSEEEFAAVVERGKPLAPDWTPRFGPVS